MIFSSIPPTFLSNLGGFDGFLLDFAQIFACMQNKRCAIADAPCVIFEVTPL